MRKTVITAKFARKFDTSDPDASDLAMKLACEFEDVRNEYGDKIASKAICNNNKTMQKARLKRGKKYVIVLKDENEVTFSKDRHTAHISYPIACQQIFI